MTVIAAGELQHAVASGDRPGETERAHRRLGARGGEAEHLDARHRGDDRLREVHLERRWCAVRGTERRLRDDRADDGGMGVTEDERAPRADQIDVFAAVGVDHPRARAGDDERRVPTDGAIGTDRARHTAGHDRLGPSEEPGVARRGHRRSSASHAAASSAK